MRAAVTLLTTAITLTTLAACGSDSTSPSGASKPASPTADALAAHYDSLDAALIAAGTHYDTMYAVQVGLLNGVIADGVVPSHVTVTVGGQQQTWNGVFANWVENDPGGDSLQLVILWNDSLADAIVNFPLYNGQPFLPGGAAGPFVPVIATRGGDSLSDSAANYAGIFSPIAGDTCAFTPINHISLYGDVTPYGNAPAGLSTFQYQCTPSVATIVGELYTAHGDTTSTAALQSIVIGQQQINGVRLSFSIPIQAIAHPLGAFIRRR